MALASIIVHYEDWTKNKDSEKLLENIFEWCDENENIEVLGIIDQFKAHLKKTRISFIEDKINIELFSSNNSHELRNMADIFTFDNQDLGLNNKLEYVWQNFLAFVNQLVSCIKVLSARGRF